jgi:predicted dehydrogenase/threonine dehydrogenase-like Zn-dependent dehydrogenase
MKQVSLRLRDGRVEVLDVPSPSPAADSVLVDVRASVLSVGTERSKIEAGRASLVGKARARPDQAREVIAKARRDGIRDTVQAVRTRLDQPMPLGYSASGVVLRVGARVRGLVPGDRVACGGGEHAVHADIVQVPGNLCARLPDSVDFESGAFATVASVAMHGVRQADARVGERIAVVGLGLVGQLTGQILRAAGCHVIGVDLAASLVDKAMELGAVDVGFERASLESDRLAPEAGSCDAVIITAAVRSADPIELAPRLLRDRGRVVVVGDVQVEVPRAPYYDREIELRFSRSYGPGRYDREYEERGLDYPIGYVRWTEQRNMAAFLDLLGAGRVDLRGLVTERIPVDDAPQAYDRLASAESSPLGVVLQYDPTELRRPPPPQTRSNGARHVPDTGVVNVVGAGSFAQRILIPGLSGAGFVLGSVASARGLSATSVADRFGFKRAVTPDEAIHDPDAGLVAIASRHSSHARLAAQALTAGKAVFVEKPPCLTWDELDLLHTARAESGQPLFVGFNRRHAPLALSLRNHVVRRGHPVELLYRVNAGRLPPDHWLDDPEDGGGRLVGEGCHFVDFACWLVGSLPVSVAAAPGMLSPSGSAEAFGVTLGFQDGSVATILYASGGASDLSKEYVEAHSGGRSGCIDDYRVLTLYDGRRRRSRRAGKRDKGHVEQFRAIASGAGTPGADLDPLSSFAVTLQAQDAMRGQAMDANAEHWPRAAGSV